MAQPLAKKDDDRDDEAEYSPFTGIEKGAVLQEARVFNDPQLDPRRCSQVITKLLYLLNQGETFTKIEATEVFFAVTKLFQSRDVGLRRMVYLIIKELSPSSDEVIIVTSSLMKDMNGKTDMYRANAIRVLCRITDGTLLTQIERYLKQAIVDKNPVVASAALVSGIHIFQTNPEIVKRWSNEVQEAIQSRAALVQFHALALLHQIRQNDRLAVSKLVTSLTRGTVRSPLAQCLLIRYASQVIRESGLNTQTGERPFYDYLESCLRHKAEMVILEAARAITELSGVTNRELTPAITVLQLFLSSSKPVLRFAAVRTLNKVAMTHPMAVTNCNIDMESLISDQNRSIATLAITTLLKTGNESSVDRLMKQITNFMSDIADEFKIVVVEAIRSLCLKFPLKYRTLMNFLSNILREEGGFEYKKAIVDSIVILIRDIPDAKESGLFHLCEFIEDCEFTYLSTQILHFLGNEVKLLTRPDMPKAFISFTEWTHEVLSSVTNDVMDHFQLLGVVEALAVIFKAGSRKVLLDLVPIVWNDTAILIKSNTAARSPLLRKFLVKLTQRIGLTCLPHRSPSWRYMGKNSSQGGSISLNVTGKHDQCSHGQNADSCNSEQNASYLREDDMDVPEIVEEIIELLLSGLRDSDTVVRWSAAKGIGRITAHLTSALADEVLSSVLELFSPGEGDGSWHGGCLALAELARRGLLLPISLPKVVPVIIKALHYDIRRGPHSVGSHVRDAAAYVCWAFGRAYYHSDMKSILEQLAPHLLTVACYDREVNCRRAAAAAFQENVGRQGSFPHGIFIVNTADYFSLSSRVNSYVHVAVCIAQYNEYLYPFVEELLYNKICHWDKGLRELAAEALSALVKYEPEYFATFVLERLIPCTLSTDLCIRHGATLAAGELVLAIHQCGHMLSTDKQKSVAGIVPAIERARLYRGKGGEIMRSAVSRFIGYISVSCVFLSEKIKRSLLDTLNENLRHPNAQIQNSAVEALKHFIPAYLLTIDDGGANAITTKYLELLSDPNVAARRGSALAIGVLPFEFLATRWRVVLLKLCSSCAIEDDADDRDAEARVNAVRGLVSVCETLSRNRKQSVFGSAEDDMSLYVLIKNEVMQTLLKALDDYSVDNRGDVGSWVREAAMDGLERCTYILCERESSGLSRKIPGVEYTELPDNDIVKTDQSYSLFDASLATSLVGGILKQAVEKIDKIRDAAGKILQRILYNDKIFIPCIPYREKLEQIVPDEVDPKWGVPTFSYPRFVQLLEFSCYSRYLISGLVISVGGLQDSLRKASIAALLEYLQDTETDKHEEGRNREYMLGNDLLWVLQQNRRCDRVVIPTLKTIEILFSKKILKMEAYTHDFCAGVLDSLAVELKGSKDFSKLYAGISILGYIASMLDPINSRAYSQLLTFLGHRYPKIRKASADQVYLVLLQSGNLVAEDKMEKALEILSETCWEGDIEGAKHQRLQLCEMAGLENGMLLKTSSRESNKAGEKKTTADENASYSSLVGSSGF